MKKKYSNYVVTFCDGRIKIGMTGNLPQRMRRYRSQAKTSGSSIMVWFATSPFSEKDTSLLFERLMCNSFKHLSAYGCREWLAGDSSVFRQIIGQYEYIRTLLADDGEELNHSHGSWAAKVEK